jgi:gamma-glutamylcyclotransferase
VTLLFAYGSNMASAEMDAWCPEHRYLGLARLDGFRVELRRRSIRWGGGAADIVPAPGERVWGVLYEVADEELDRLDEKEGEGFAYRRRAVEVEYEGERRAAVAYEVINKEPEQVEATPEYLALLRAAARERGLPR